VRTPTWAGGPGITGKGGQEGRGDSLSFLLR
jgi:hypothetical protein